MFFEFFCGVYFKLFFFILLHEAFTAKYTVTITLSGSYNTPDWIYGVTIANDIAFVAGYNNGLEIINVTVPSNPTFIGNYDTSGEVYWVTVVNDIAYVADGFSGLQIINVTNPSNPALIGNYDTPDTAWGVTVDNDIAYVADYANGLQIINVTNPSNPTLIGNCDTPGHAIRVTVVNGIAYIADWDGGLQIINVNNPSYPTLIGNYTTPGIAEVIDVVNDIAYMSDQDGLQIINIVNPSNPILIGNYTTPGDALGITIDNDIAYVADGTSGLQIIDVSNPSIPALIGNYATPYAYEVTVVNDIVYVADQTASGLVILKVQYYTSSDSIKSESPVLGSFTITMLAVTSFSIIMILIFIIIKSKLLWFYQINYDIFYLVFPLMGIINLITDILFIFYLSLFRYHLIYLIISSSIFILSIILNYLRTFKWKKLFNRWIITQNNYNDMIHYLSKNRTLFDNIVNLSVIHPAILFILKSNYKEKDCFRLPIGDSYISIPIQCILYDIYSLIPQSGFVCLNAIEYTPSEWNIILWIIILFKFLNLIISFCRIITVLYSGGGTGKSTSQKFGGHFSKGINLTSMPSLSTSQYDIDMSDYGGISSIGDTSISSDNNLILRI